jgi:hypothetical protein
MDVKEVGCLFPARGEKKKQLATADIPIVKTLSYVHWYTVHSSASLETSSYVYGVV